MGLPDWGVGVGLRAPHHAHIFEHRPPVDWLEIISENYFAEGGHSAATLARVLETYRVVQHGVALSIGSTADLDHDYLRRLKRLLATTGSPWVSDHLCWTGTEEANLHDLFPLPYTDEAVRHVAARARTVQDVLETRLVLENVSSYMTFCASAMTEWDFLGAIADEADCGILLDVNNVFVSAKNHGFDARAYLDALPVRRVVQMHLAGHTDRGTHLLDTHSAPVADPVWDLYRHACERFGAVSTLIEWDEAIPAWDVLMAEAERAKRIREEVLGER
jgi:uncharacterized protein (UPF0276 family)